MIQVPQQETDEIGNDTSLVPEIQAEPKENCIEVVAPSCLQEGFHLSVTYDGKDATVVVVRTIPYVFRPRSILTDGRH